MFHKVHRSAFFSVAMLSLLLAIAIFSLRAHSTSYASLGSIRPETHDQVDGGTVHSSPVMFVENVGQFGEGARFKVLGGAGEMWLTGDALWITVVDEVEPETQRANERPPFADPIAPTEPITRTGVNIKLSFPGANPNPRMEPFDRLDTKISYFFGNDPDKWQPDVPVWGGVRYVDLYPGADLKIMSQDNHWFWQLECNTDCRDILGNVELQVDGAETLSLIEDNLRLITEIGDFILPLIRTSESLSVTSERKATLTAENQVRFPFADSSRHEVIGQGDASDLTYATFLGGSSRESGNSVAVDGIGAAYVTGYSYSTDFSTTPGVLYTTTNGSADVFVVKVNPTGTALTYVTFVGGSNGDWGGDIALDGVGSAYVTGRTESSNFPITSGAFDTTYGGGDAFVVKLDPSGNTLEFSTFLGGSESDSAFALAVDSGGGIYIGGATISADFPVTPNTLDNSYNGGTCGSQYTPSACEDGFLAKLSLSGSSLEYSTYLGGRANDNIAGLVIDPSGFVLVTGSTNSSDFPVTSGTFDSTFQGGDSCAHSSTNWLPCSDAYIAKITSNGFSMTFATFLGGNDWDYGNAITLDETGAVYVSGYTSSNDFPTTPGVFDTTFDGYSDAFVVKLNPSGMELDYATFLGGTGYEAWGPRITIDGSRSVYIAGSTSSSDFPVTSNAFDTTFDGPSDSFLVKLNPIGTDLDYATFLGGGDNENGLYSIAVDRFGAAYVSGFTNSSDFPTSPGAFDTTYNGGNNDAFVVKLTLPGSTAPGPTPTPPLPTPTATPSFPTCTVSVDKIAYPSLARIDGQIGVTLRLTGDCPNSEVKAPLDVTLIIDRSQSMCGTKLNQAQEAGKQFLDSMAFPPDQAAIVSFANTAQLHSELTGNRTQATNALYNSICGGFSRIDSGLTSAYAEMSGPRRVAGHTPAIILLTDGNPEGAYADDVRAAANQIHAAGIALYTVGLGSDVNAALLREIATSPDYFYQSPSPSDLAQIYTRLAGEIRNVPAANIDLTDVVAPEFEIVPNSFSGAAMPQVNGQTLTWNLPQVSEGSTEVGFSVKPTQCGTFAVNSSASAQYDDNRGNRQSLTFPVPTVTVDGCSPDLTDMYIRDNDNDIGQIPSGNPWWLSPDIWIRHADDGGTQHMNPQAGQRNYIYARIWNRGTTTIGDIDVDFYFANPGLGLTWPNDWTLLPVKQHIPSIAPGSYAVVSIPWDVPNITGHFCLFVRISAPTDPIRDDRVPWENNIAQRNLHIIDYPQPQPGACQLNEAGMYEDRIEFDVINTLATSTPVDIEITASGLPPDAQVWLHPGPLANRWSSLDGLEIEPDGRLRILRFPAHIYGIRLNPLESRRVTLEIHAPGNSLFTIGFSESVRGNVVGGNSYQRWLPPCPLHLPIVIGPHPTPTPCPSDQYIPPDVMLVLDRSGSMADEGKMGAAKQAIRVFLSQMDFSQEKAGIASFAGSATLDHILSQNRSSLEAALNGLVADGSTAIGEGIAVAQTELESNRHVPGHTRVIVLLSDGNNFAGRDPLAAAASAKTTGIRIVTIGLGSNADANLLRHVASASDDYYYAPGPDALAELYRVIAGKVRCNPSSPNPTSTSTPTLTPTPTATATSTTPTPIPPGPPRVIFDGDPRNSAWLCDGGFRSDCNFADCVKDLRLAWGPFCRNFDYPDITPGKYFITVQGQGNINLGATDFGLTGELFSFGKHEASLPAGFTFCWPGLQPGGFGFEIIVQSKGTNASVNRIKIEHLGVVCD